MATVSRLAKRYLFVSIGSLALATTQAAYGQEPADEIAELRKLLAEQAQRLDRQRERRQERG